MKAYLSGIQHVDFTNRETGEQIVGTKLHLVSDSAVNDKNFTGKKVATIFTKDIDCSRLKVGNNIELTYEQNLGDTRARLVAITNI